MNSSFFNVILGGFGATDQASSDLKVKSKDLLKVEHADDAAFLMKNASSVIIVPRLWYGSCSNNML